MNFDWSELAFASKTPINQLKAVFIAAPRELSPQRFKQLVKEYLPKGNIVLGLAKEPFILGFEGQPQFRTLQASAIESIVSRVDSSGLEHRVYFISYFQRELNFLLEKLDFKRAVFVNGSWKYAFHMLPGYFILLKRGLPFELVSPFADEAEAKQFVEQTKLLPLAQGGIYSESEMLELAVAAAKQSYDYGFQTGVALGRKAGAKYELLATSFNVVVPYQTYAMHHGTSREANFSLINDQNHYDATHAEVEIMIKAQKQKIDLSGATLFINLLPCPSCARMLLRTDINEFVYSEDHSAGYAVKMLELAGKQVRRLVL